MNLPRFALPILLIAFVALAVIYSVTIPLGEAADEVTHFAYVQFLAAHQQLPSSVGAVAGESQQPPLYYLVGAITTSWISRQDSQVIANPDFVPFNPQIPNLLLHTRREAFPYRGDALAWHLIRLLSILMGAVTIWSTWRLAQLLFPGDDWIALGAATCVAFLPGFLLISSVVNNDNLVVMLMSLSMLQVLYMTQRSWNSRDAIVLGILLGLALLTKVSALVVWLFVVALFAYRAVKTKEWRNAVFSLALCFGTAVALFLPWVIYNLQTVGDPFAWSVYLSVVSLRINPMGWPEWADIARGLFTSFWGRFGGALELRMPTIFYAALAGLTIAALASWLGYARDAIEHRLNPRVRVLFVLFAVFWLLLLTSYARWSMVDLAAGQARLLFPGLPLLALGLTAGIARLFRQHEEIALSVWCGIFSFIALWVLLTVNLTYAAPVPRGESLPALGGLSAPSDFGGTIRVIDYSRIQTHAAPGDSIPVDFYWQAIDNPKADYWLLLQLVGREGVIANQDGVPTSGRLTTDWWLPGQVFASRHTLRVPKGIAPGTYTLRFGLHPFGKWEWLPVRNREMLDLARITVD